MKRILITFALSFIMLVMVSCSDNKKPEEPTEIKPSDEVMVTNVLPEKQQKKLIQILEGDKVSNVDEFFKWVDEYNNSLGSDTDLITNWEIEDNVDYDTEKITKLYDNGNPDKKDVSPQLAAFLLTEATFTSKDISEYGSYITEDVNALDSDERYEKLKENKSRFIAIFDEVDSSKLNSDEDYYDIFPVRYKENEIDFNKEKVSLINVVMPDDNKNVLYIAHSAVLVELEDGYILLEKLEEKLPYQFSVCAVKDKLFEMLLDRDKFDTDETKVDAFILENNQPHKLDI